MSHFSVLVVLPDNTPMIETSLEEVIIPLMRPYHEFECTGFDDEYVQNVDVTEKVREAYAKVEDREESLVSYAKEYYGYETLCPGEEPELDGRHKYGWVRASEGGETLLEVVKRTNPNKKWDYWRIGGRWAGKLKAPANEPHLTTEPSWEWKMKDNNPYQTDLPGIVCCDATTARSARVAYQRVTPSSSGKNSESPYRTFAVLMDGTWYQRGRMGWFGCVSDNIGEDEWNGQLEELWNKIPDDAVLVVVDCHI